MRNLTFNGTIHPSTLGKMADGVNCITQSYLFKTNFNGKNFIRSQKSSHNDLARFCEDFQSQWEENLTRFSKFMHEGRSEERMQWYNLDYLPYDNCYGELSFKDEGVRLFRTKDGWTIFVALDLDDLKPFKVYQGISRCLEFMQEHTDEFPEPEVQDEEFLEDDRYFTELAFNDVCKFQRFAYWESDLILRAETAYKEWLEKKESDIINNNNEDEDCPF